MTTLSTLIGQSGSSLGLGELATPQRQSLWQRVGGVFKRRRNGMAEATANEAAASEIAAAEALKEIIDDDFSDDQSASRFDDGTLSDSVDEARAEQGGPPSLLPPQPPRRLRLWGNSSRKDQAIEEVRNGMSALASLLGGIQSHMEQQGARQQELLGYISQLPKATAANTEVLSALRDQVAAGSAMQNESLHLIREQIASGSAAQTQSLLAVRDQLEAGAQAQAASLAAMREQIAQASACQSEELLALREQLAEGSSTQSQSLQSIRDQIAQGSSAQVRLCAALERLGGLQDGTGQALTSISRRIDQMDARDAAFTSSMERVSDAMQTVSRASETGAIVLERVENSISTRDEGVNRTIDKHQGKFNALMAVAISVAAAALAVVGGVAYVVMTKVH
jgi:ribosomal protein L29